jgi:hypothetical protein
MHDRTTYDRKQRHCGAGDALILQDLQLNLDIQFMFEWNEIKKTPACLNSSVFWLITQSKLVLTRRFWTTYRSIFKGQLDP